MKSPSTPPTVHIRMALPKDIPAITKIYNEAILTTTATFDTTLKTLEEQTHWFQDHGKKNPIMVAEHDRSIVAWGSLSQWSDRCAYTDTAEVSLYVTDSYRGKGIGTQLLQALLDKGRKQGLHAVLARITEGNAASLHLHESLGFFSIGVMKEVGVKFDRRLDVNLMEKILSNEK